MAEAVVKQIVEKLGSLIKEEIKLLGGARKEVEGIIQELEFMTSLLRDADARQEGDSTVNTWVKQVRELAYDSEDCIAEFMSRLEEPAPRLQRPACADGLLLCLGRPPCVEELMLRLENSDGQGCLGFLNRVLFFLQTLIPRHQIATEIQELKTRALELRERSLRYQFAKTEASPSPSFTATGQDDPRLAALYIGDAQLVGIDQPRHKLVEWLTKGGSHLAVISVVGMGGIGKTTLVKKAYERVKDEFSCRAWITVSQSFDGKELLKWMMRELSAALPQEVDATVQELINILRCHLQGKRYVIVFDDIWRTNAWELFKCTLPDGNSGSRVIITTRFEDVASSCTETCDDQVYKLQPLPLKEAWDLFCRKAFGSKPEHSCPPHLKELSQGILKKCGGLPLAIVTIGGLLSHKPVSDWKRFHDNLGYELRSDSSNDSMTNMMKILELSYNDLPYHLKPCFLYFSIFPEDYIINCSRLRRLWAAEGFTITGDHGMTAEEVAEGYLREFINRSMIQATDMHSDGRVKHCQIHDLVREILLTKSKDENFATHEHGTKSRDKVRRLAIQDGEQLVLESTHFPHLRSFISFGQYGKLYSLSSTFFSSMRLLRVLDFEYSSLQEFPSEIPELVHLKYLSLRRLCIKELPVLEKFRNLETLDLRYSEIREFNTDFSKLQQLRHLLVSYLKVPVGIGNLKALEKLSRVDAQGPGTRELGQLTQLKALQIRYLIGKDAMMEFNNSVEKLSGLTSLKAWVEYRDGMAPFNLHSISTPPLLLQCLVLHGPLDGLPHWVASHQNLVKIHFEGSTLREDLFQALQNLPNLLELHLRWQAYDGEDLCSDGEGFPRLKILELKSLTQLVSVRIEVGAMSCLEKLTIDHCPCLKEMPLGIENLKNLEELHFLFMPEECIHRLQRYQDGDRSRVEHIPSIQYKGDKRWSQLCILQDLRRGYVEQRID